MKVSDILWKEHGETEKKKATEKIRKWIYVQNPNLRFHYFYSSFQSLPAKVGVNRVRGKKTSKCTLKREREKKKK